MNDLISRQEAVNAILHYTIRIPDYMSEWGKKLTAAIKKDLIDDIEAIPPAPEWIPVTERLPEEEVHVLVTRKYGTKRYVETAELLCGEWLCDMDEYKINPKVHSKPIAWMPLPEPYAESSHPGRQRGGEE